MGIPAGQNKRFWQALRQALVLTGVMLFSLGLYLTVLWWRGPSATIFTETAWDRLIPFYPAWVWVYLIPYLAGPVIVGFLSAETFVWYLRRGLLLVFVSLIIFVVLPTKTVRPDANGLADSFTASFYRGMVKIDGPAANAAPSLHVSLTCLLAWALLKDWKEKGKGKKEKGKKNVVPVFSFVLFTLSFPLVWLSTLLTRQHHLIDVATGVGLATLLALPRRLWRSTAGSAAAPTQTDWPQSSRPPDRCRGHF